MKKTKIISISGTPGTGKTIIAEKLTNLLDANLIQINEVIKEMPCKTDKKRNTKIVDIKILQKAVNKQIKKEKTNIIDGHLSHFLKSDFIIVLRTDPKILEKRLKNKNWRKEKILENVQSEILDEITIETTEKHKINKIIEIDTSRRMPKDIAKVIFRILNNQISKKRYAVGKISWLKKYYKMLET